MNLYIQLFLGSEIELGIGEYECMFYYNQKTLGLVKCVINSGNHQIMAIYNG